MGKRFVRFVDVTGEPLAVAAEDVDSMREVKKTEGPDVGKRVTVITTRGDHLLFADMPLDAVITALEAK